MSIKLAQAIKENFDIESVLVNSTVSDKSLEKNFRALLPIYMLESLKDISIENDYLLELMDNFFPEWNGLMCKYDTFFKWQGRMDNFDQFKHFSIKQLAIVKDFLLYLSSYQIELFTDSIAHGLYAVEWNSKLVEIYNALAVVFGTDFVLEKQEVLASFIENAETDDELVWDIRELLANKSWVEVPEEDYRRIIIDYIWLSDKARCFITPAVILYFDYLEWTEYFFTSTHHIEGFNLLTYAQANLVARFLALHYELYSSLAEGGKDEEEAKKYWYQFLSLKS